MSGDSSHAAPPSRARAWLSTLPVVLLLGGVILHGFGETVHARLLTGGESLFSGYAELRNDPVAPTCDPNAEEGAAPASDSAELSAAEAVEAKAEAKGEDFLDDLLGDEEENGADALAAREAANKRCAAEHARFTELKSRSSTGLKIYRAFEGSVAAFVQTGVSYLRHILVLLLLFAALTASMLRAHIALRPVQSRKDLIVSEGVSLIAALSLFVSSAIKWKVDLDSGLVLQNAGIPVIWMLGFAGMSLISAHHLWRGRASLSPGGSTTKALATVPLYTVMACIGALHFFLFEGHPAGLAIYLQKLTEHALLYLHVGLYVWAGMLLKRTRIAELCFDTLRPFALPPEILAFVVVVAAALPTAYSGASGIFVIAAGAVIYEELIRAGARQQLALAATAMSGSLGVVLSPCLLVVIVASLNKQVTTDQLFGWGWKVFLLTATLFLIAALILGRRLPRIAKPGQAVKGSLKAFRPLLPYIFLAAVILLIYGLGLSTTLNEHTAPSILPVLLLLLLIYDRRAAKRAHALKLASESAASSDLRPPGDETASAPAARRVAPSGFGASIFEATSETTAHIGALLMLMGLSVVLGGVIERGDLMSLVPHDFGSPVMAMVVLVAILVFVGMVMDPYGAVILVSVALAEIAYKNGIAPVHFWMVVLVAFELGYLSPPVALNHLLTRQVVGADLEAIAEASRGQSFFLRHERILLPMGVMTTALLIVAFVPLFW